MNPAATPITAPTTTPYASRWLIALAFISVTTLGAWAYYAELDQIARAQGQVIATARTQVIQSANDGVLEALQVKEGDVVKKGQLLARLERSQAAAARQDSLGKVAALKATLIRLQAEVFDRPLVFPADVRAHPAFVTTRPNSSSAASKPSRPRSAPCKTACAWCKKSWCSTRACWPPVILASSKSYACKNRWPKSPGKSPTGAINIFRTPRPT